jgi:hypothetical protein
MYFKNIDLDITKIEYSLITDYSVPARIMKPHTELLRTYSISPNVLQINYNYYVINKLSPKNRMFYKYPTSTLTP